MNYRTIIKTALPFILFAVGTWILYAWFEDSAYYAPFTIYLTEHIVGAVIILLLLKIISVLWPPFASGILIFILIPEYGWFLPFLVDYAGEVIGSTIAYFIAKAYGISLLSRILSPELLQKVESTRIKKGREFEMLFILRFVGWTFFEIVCYAAGLLKIRYSTFLYSMLLSYAITGIIVFRFVDSLFQGGTGLFINGLLLLGALAFMYWGRTRYIEDDAESGNRALEA